MKIADLICTAGRAGFFNRDLAAVKAGARADGFAYPGRPVSPGFTHIVQPGTAISVMLMLDDGQVAFGDCMDVILSGVAGRDPLFRAEDHLGFLQTVMRERLRGRPIDRFRPLAEEVDRSQHQGRPLHTALRYGVTQALLHAAALANHCTMAEIVAREYACDIAKEPLPILASCHKEDVQMIDRMILKRVELLPHASFQQVERDIGLNGEKLVAYAQGIVCRVREIGDPDYRPIIHLDVYGTIGELFGEDTAAIAHYLGELAAAVAPHELLVESFVIAPSRAAQIERFRALRAALRQAEHRVGIIVDEWCNTLDDIKAFADAEAADYAQIKTPDLGGVNNTIEAVLYARAKGMGCCLGGSGNETDQSARITAQIGLATRPSFLLSKPGFGGDEALMIQINEMLRTLALIEARGRAYPTPTLSPPAARGSRGEAAAGEGHRRQMSDTLSRGGADMPLPQDIRPVFQDIQDTLVRLDSPWIEQSPTAKMKVLWVGRETGTFALLIHWKKGHVASPHKHLAGAHAYVISGKLQVRNGTLDAGDYVYEPSGILHDATTALEDTTYLFICNGAVLYFDENSFTRYLNWEVVEKLRAQHASVPQAQAAE